MKIDKEDDLRIKSGRLFNNILSGHKLIAGGGGPKIEIIIEIVERLGFDVRPTTLPSELVSVMRMLKELSTSSSKLKVFNDLSRSKTD